MDRALPRSLDPALAPRPEASPVRLSVIIPNFNHGAYLAAAVHSCFAGPAGADEVVVVDDASTDSSHAVLAHLAQEYPGLRVVQHSVNQGPAVAQNSGLAVARGDWVLFRAADDLCPPGSLLALRRAAARYPAAGLITGDLVYFARDSARGVVEHLGRSAATTPVEATTYLPLFGGNIIHGASTFVRAAWAREAGGLDPTLRWHCDWYLLMALGLARGFVYTPEVLGAMRLNPSSYNAAGTASSATQARVLTRIIERLESSPELLERMLACGCLDFFGHALRHELEQGPETRRARFAPLLRAPTPEIAAARAATGLATVFRAFLERHHALLRQHADRVAIYGAGGHTHQLLAVWRAQNLPPPFLILDSAPAAPDQNLDGIPVRSPQALPTALKPLVVLSSKSYEQLFASTMDTILPGVPYLRIWGSDEA